MKDIVKKLPEFVARLEEVSVSKEWTKKLRTFIVNKPWAIYMIEIELHEYLRAAEPLRELCYSSETDAQGGFIVHHLANSVKKHLEDETYHADNRSIQKMDAMLEVIKENSTALDFDVKKSEDRRRHKQQREAARQARLEWANALKIPVVRGESDEEHRDKKIKVLIKVTNDLLYKPPMSKEGLDYWVRNAMKFALDYYEVSILRKQGAMRFFRGADGLRPDSVYELKDEDEHEHEDEDEDDEDEDNLRKRAEDLASHPKFDDNKLECLVKEMKEFKAEIADWVEDEDNGHPNSKEALTKWTRRTNLLDYHYKNRDSRPLMFFAAVLVALAQPSSAAVERVFSCYRNLNSSQQESALWDQKSSGVVLGMFKSCNNREPPRIRRGNGGSGV
jgi:hypothetical protein